MPVPKSGESESDFVARGVPVVMKEDGANDTDHAVAKCHGIYKQHQQKNDEDERYFRSDVALGLAGAGGVDREAKIIRGFAVVKKGEAKGHKLEIDNVTLNQVVALGNAKSNGNKSRFGHPNISHTAFGTYLGRSKNFRLDNDIVRADLHLSDTSFKTPQGDLGTYVMDMADDEPDMFGASIVFPRGFDEENNEEAGLRDANGILLRLARVTELNGIDVVDDAASGDNFFNKSVKLSAEMTKRLDKYLSSPSALENIEGFLNRYVENKEARGLIQKKLEKVVSMPDEKKEKLKFLPSTEEENTMTDAEKLAAKKLAEETQMKRDVEIAEAATEKERLRSDTIYATCEDLKISREFAQKLITDKVTLEEANVQIIEYSKTQMAKGASPIDLSTPPQVGADEADKRIDGMSNALMVRSSLEKDQKIISDVNKSTFRGLSIQNLAKQCLMNEGISDAYMFDGNELYNEMVGRFSSFAQAPTQGSGDFVNVLSNVLNKSAGKGWATAASTYDGWVGHGSLRDFKTADIPRLSEMGDVKDVMEGEAPEMAMMSDMKEQTRLKTKGTKYILSRQAMVNDDMSMLTTIAARQMRALRRQMNKDCYGLIYNNNGSGTAFQGPTMGEDSAVCFNGTAESTSGGHNNYWTTASGPTQAALDVAFIAFKDHRALRPDEGRSGVIYLNIGPAYLLCGPRHELAAYKLFTNIGYNVSGEDSAALGTNAANIHGPGQPRSLTVIVDSEIDHLNSTYYPWYLATNPLDVDTVVLYTLNGQTTPYSDAAPTPTGDARGMIWVIEHDYRFAIGDWRGLACIRGTS